jgi:hypothetical protein
MKGGEDSLRGRQACQGKHNEARGRWKLATGRGNRINRATKRKSYKGPNCTTLALKGNSSAERAHFVYMRTRGRGKCRWLTRTSASLTDWGTCRERQGRVVLLAANDVIAGNWVTWCERIVNSGTVWREKCFSSSEVQQLTCWGKSALFEVLTTPPSTIW